MEVESDQKTKGHIDGVTKRMRKLKTKTAVKTDRNGSGFCIWTWLRNMRKHRS